MPWFDEKCNGDDLVRSGKGSNKLDFEVSPDTRWTFEFLNKCIGNEAIFAGVDFG